MRKKERNPLEEARGMQRPKQQYHGLILHYCFFSISYDDGILCHSSSSLLGSLFLSRRQISAFCDDRLLQTQLLIKEARTD